MKPEYVWILLFCLLFVPNHVRADAGFDYLGIRIDSGWDCDSMLTALQTLPQPVPAGWLDDTTFGKNTECLERLLSSGKISKARAHLLNNTCVRNKNCWDGDLLNGYTLPQIQAEALLPGSRLLGLVCSGAERIEAYAKKYPKVRFRVSGLLEHNMTRDAAIAVVDTVHKCAPDADAVDNPVNPYPPIDGAIRESHGTSVNPITSLDGQSLEDVDVEAWKKANAGEDMTLIWALPFNCRLAKGWVQPNLRKNCPTADDFSLYAKVWLPEAPIPAEKPAACRTVAPAASPEFYKTEAEDDGTGKPQAGKPLFASTERAERTDALAANGRALGSFKLLGPAKDNTWRFSLGLGSGQTAFQLGQLAEKQAGSAWVVLKTGEKCVWANAYRTAPVPPSPPTLSSVLRGAHGAGKTPR